jgi:hypothetical protein
LTELGEASETFEVGALLVGRSRVPRWLSGPADRKQARRDAERAIEIAEALDSPYLLSYAIEALSQPTVQDGFCEGAAIAERLIGVAETLSDRIEAQETRVLATLHFSRADRHEAARRAADAAAREATELSPHRRLHGDLNRLRTAAADVPEMIHEDGGRVCPYGAVACAGHALTLFEAGEDDAAAAAVDLVDRAVQGAEGPTLLFRAAEILRPLANVQATRSRLERIAGSADTVPRIYELRAALQVHALCGDPGLDDLIAEARALAGPTCAPSLAALGDWAESVQLARAGASAAALATARHAVSELEAHGERYTAARVMTDLLPFLEEEDAAAAAAHAAERLDAMDAHASLNEARRYIRG